MTVTIYTMLQHSLILTDSSNVILSGFPGFFLCFMIIKNCFCVATSYQFFTSIRAGVALPLFSQLGNSTTNFQNELTETLVISSHALHSDTVTRSKNSMKLVSVSLRSLLKH